MKKLCSVFLAAVLMLGLMAAPVSAEVKYEEFTLDISYDRSVTFSAAAVGYGLVEQPMMWTDVVFEADTPSIYPVVVLKDSSRVTVNAPESWGENPSVGFSFWEVYDIYDGKTLFDPRVSTTHDVTTGSVSQLFDGSKLGAAVIEWLKDGTHQGGMLFISESQADSFPLVYPGPERVMPYENWAQVKTAFQSTAQLTKAYIADMDYNQFDVTVTNNGDYTDVGIVALVLASDIATVTLMNYEVPAHSSKTYSVTCVGHMGSSDSRLTMVSGMEKYVNASIVHFESVDDCYAFCNTIVFEVNAENNTKVQQNLDAGSFMVCNSTAGSNWLKSVGMTRKAQPPVYPYEDHGQCTTVDFTE